MPARFPTYFVSHGGGPWPWMKDQLGPAYDKLEASLVDIKRQVGERPKAVLVVSSHWEANGYFASSGDAPAMVTPFDPPISGLSRMSFSLGVYSFGCLLLMICSLRFALGASGPR